MDVFWAKSLKSFVCFYNRSLSLLEKSWKSTCLKMVEPQNLCALIFERPAGISCLGEWLKRKSSSISKWEVYFGCRKPHKFGAYLLPKCSVFYGSLSQVLIGPLYYLSSGKIFVVVSRPNIKRANQFFHFKWYESILNPGNFSSQNSF